ncbi:hypothetical protein D3C76_1841450 [compost metagenome]
MDFFDVGPGYREAFSIRRVDRHEADRFVGFEEEFFNHALTVGRSNHHILTWH